MNNFLHNRSTAAVIGLAIALSCILWPFQYVKYLALKATMPFQVLMEYNTIIPVVALQSQNSADIKMLIWSALLPYLLTIIAIETLTLFIKRFDRQPFRTVLLFAQFTFSTFLLFGTVFFILDFIFDINLNMDWMRLQTLLNWGFQKRAIVSFLILFIIFTYLSLVLARLRNHFSNTQEQIQQRKFREKIRK